MIFNAGVPLMSCSRAKAEEQLGQIPDDSVKFLLIRSTKHLTSAPLPPFRYLSSCLLQRLQKISTVLVGPFLLGLAIGVKYHLLSILNDLVEVIFQVSYVS